MGEGVKCGWRLRVQTTVHKIDRLQGCVTQHTEIQSLYQGDF